MPWKPKDAARFTKKARSPKQKRQFAHVANAMLDRGYSESRAIRAASSVVKKSGRKKSRTVRARK